MDACPPHHYIVARPAGPEVEAVCKRCGQRRTYPTTLPEVQYNKGVKLSLLLKQKERIA